VSLFKRNLPNYPPGILWMNPLGSLTILFKTYPQFAWATHWEFFHKIPSNLTTIYLVRSFQRTHNKLSKNSLSMWVSILWLNFWAFLERTFNEWLRKVVGKFWTNSQLTHWAKWEQIDHKLSTNPQFACQIRPPLPPVSGLVNTEAFQQALTPQI